MARVEVENLGIRFGLDRQHRPVTPALTRVRRRCTTIWALRGLSLVVEPGMGLALLGRNGAGKTTLLRAIAGVLAPDEGRVTVHGRIGSLLSVNAGLMPLLTGRENALMLGVLGGLRRADASDAIDEIRRRSGLDGAFERPVSTYSQGMRARLGFAVVERCEPDLLVLDEVHEAIDETFRRELVRRAHDMRRRGGIVIAAGHDHEHLGHICDEAVILEDSRSYPATEFRSATSTLWDHHLPAVG